MTSRLGTIAVAGALAQKPGYGGHTWALLQYVLGFRELGWDVLFIDQIASAQCLDAAGRRCDVRQSVAGRYFVDVMKRFGLLDQAVLIVDEGRAWIGLDERRVVERLKQSAFLLNVMGYLSHPKLLGAARRRVFLDIDPGFGQMWRALGLHDLFAGHDAHVTIAERIHEADCEIPDCGIDWITTAQPIALSYWPPAPVRGCGFCSVASWRGAYDPVEYLGKTYGLRVHEFRRFLDLPSRTGQRFELALDIHEAEVADLARLRSGGWHLVAPRAVAATPWMYQAYIQGAAAEFMVAKNMYVATRSGWLSDRTLCYLSSAKPVLAQETGWSRLYPAGEGLVPFDTIEQAVEGARSIVSDYDRHSRAARALAEEFFDARTILAKLVARLN